MYGEMIEKRGNKKFIINNTTNKNTMNTQKVDIETLKAENKTTSTHHNDISSKRIERPKSSNIDIKLMTANTIINSNKPFISNNQDTPLNQIIDIQSNNRNILNSTIEIAEMKYNQAKQEIQEMEFAKKRKQSKPLNNNNSNSNNNSNLNKNNINENNVRPPSGTKINNSLKETPTIISETTMKFRKLLL